ncbi:MAG: beta-galactosidase, partial [Armatimonadetes bacterium]|nr:beta-galactosidase [Armatimonadota bacterium]
LVAEADDPIRLPSGEPLVCIYYFPHWWEPWKSDDEVVRQDFQRLRKMGFNTLLLDHEWSQAIDGNWKWLERAHRLAQEAGLSIVPWLSLKTWSDVGSDDRIRLFKEWFGVQVPFGLNQEGSRAAPLIYDDAVLRGGAQYATSYLDRYADKALLKVKWNDGTRPVICLGVEAAWDGSFDETTNLLFCRWLRDRYKTVKALNTAWKRDFHDFLAIDPRDSSVFDYKNHVAGQAKFPQAVEDHVEFRSEMISDSMARMGALVKRKYPNVLLLAEIPYQYGSKHPHAAGYRIAYGANPRSCDYADIVLFRNTGPLDGQEIKSLRDRQKGTGQKFVFTYRTYSDWDVAPESPQFEKTVTLYANQAGKVANGFGFYSWNEMVDTHVAYSPKVEPLGWTPERSEKAIALLAAMVKRYREQVK